MRNTSRNGTFLVCSIFMTILVLLNFFCPTSGDPQPSYANNILYLHYDDDQDGDNRSWMNASADMISGGYSGSAGIGSFTLDFPMKPSLDRILLPDPDVQYNVVVTLHLDADATNPLNPISPLRNVCIELNIGNSQTRAEAPDNVDPGYITFNLHIGMNRIENGTSILLTVHFEVIEGSYNLHADGSSLITFSLLEDTDFDGDPDSTDLDDDNDGFTDEKEIAAGTDPKDPNSKPSSDGDDGNGGGFVSQSWPWILGITVLIIIVLVVVFVYKKR
ncbi:MAG: hypothetical protein JSW00_17315 [Thermoplasmata archaeon]|nr:MAG: hypothetical protein JSW00_17315 [Thermoplasmata archaeon]